MYLILIALLVSSFAQAKPNVIWGEDDRQEVYSTPAKYLPSIRAVAGLVHNTSLQAAGDYFRISSQTLSERGVCSNERFASQPAPIKCTGFLIDRDILVTAGHCLWSEVSCEVHSWVFDYAYDTQGKDLSTVHRSQVYRCKKLIKQVYERDVDLDYAIVQLDRPVLDRDPLPIRKKGKIDDQEKIFTIGHSSGLPQKVILGARVLDNKDRYGFFTNLDVFEGNSGSPVIGEKSGVVEGIMIRGSGDYLYDEQRGCYAVTKCEDSFCDGETATRITNLWN